MGPYCVFCGRRCFVPRVLPSGPDKGRYLILATCAGGMTHDLEATGHTHQTSVNPVTDPAAAERIAAEVTAAAGQRGETGDPLDESQRFQVQEARDCLGTWDLARDGNPGIDRERVLADQLRTVLAIVDALAPKEADR